MRMIHLRVVLLALAAFLAQPARAQNGESSKGGERGGVHLRNACRLAAQVLTHGEPAEKREWALWRISDCGETGPIVLAEMWRNLPSDASAVEHAIYRSVRMRDRRLYETIALIARDPAEPIVKRAGALHLLGRWARPGVLLDYSGFLSPDHVVGTRVENAIVASDHDTQVDGAQPLPPTVRSDVAVIVGDLADHDPNLLVRDVARALRRWLR